MSKTPPPRRVEEVCAHCRLPIPYDALRWVLGDKKVRCSPCHEKRKKKRPS